MSTKQMLTCDGPGCRNCVAIRGMNHPTPSYLRLQASQDGWSKRGPKDYCPACDKRLFESKRKHS
jgi:hypothetical protein